MKRTALCLLLALAPLSASAENMDRLDCNGFEPGWLLTCIKSLIAWSDPLPVKAARQALSY
jgi:hypothetical protein